MYRLEEVSGIPTLSPFTKVSQMVRLQDEGMLALIDSDGRGATVLAANVKVIAKATEFVAAVGEKFGGSCQQVSVEGLPKTALCVKFVVPTNEHVEKPGNFLIAVQRKLTDVVRQLDNSNA